MADSQIPGWLKNLPLAPEYHPTETEFADPIAFISRIEREAAAYGICKVIPPLPRPSKRFVLANLNRSFAKYPDLGPGAGPASAPSPETGVFTTRHQELGSRRRTGPPPVHKQVWQSGELYTLEQFEAKSRDFSRSQLGRFKEVCPLLVESLFWKAAAEKPIYVEYANDVPGSGFCAPFRNCSHRQKWKKGQGKMDGPKCPYLETSGGDGRQQGTGSEREGTPGWRLSNSPWNLQMIARSPGSLTRFMPDEVPGVTSPMVYIGMLFSWFAWHVEDHELHSMNFLHMGSPKTWYAVPGEHASTVEEIMRVKGYGGNMDRLAAFTLLGEKTTLLSPEVLVASGVPCCRLVQHPGEYVVTFPRAYHVGFSHGFNCGEAANFATPQWLKVAKEAAVRRAAMNYLPMLSHQQLLYLLTMSFVSRIPRELLPGVRSSRLRDRKKEEREILVKKAFMNDMMNENHLLCALLAKESTLYAVLWEPELLPSPCIGSLSFPSSTSLELQGSQVDDRGRKRNHCSLKDKISFDCKTGKFCVGNELHEMTANLTSVQCDDLSSVDTQNTACNVDGVGFNMEMLEDIDANDDDLPYGLNADSGSLACVACGILGYPFMAIVQPSERAWQELFPVNYEEFHEKSGKPQSCLPSIARKLHSDDSKKVGIKSEVQGNLDSSCMLYPTSVDHALTEGACARGGFGSLNDDFMEFSSQITTLPHVIGGKVSRTISGLQAESISTRMHQTSAISLPINSVNNDERGHILSQVECQLDKFNPHNVDADFASNKGSNIDYSKALYSCDRSEEFGESVHVNASAIAECGSSHMNVSGLRSTYETNRLPGAPAEKSENKINKKWNTSSRFTKPRIFCLQHALEIEELLQCKGGANVLIICHSDYVKIKAHAMSVAEEIGMKFNCKDVPLENASPEELDLINISIDDEHEEHGEDWTSNLGLNLRYCVKLRKQSSANKQQLPLALAAIFSDPIPVSVVSDLKWHSRKTRTPYKVIGMIQSKPPNDSKLEIVEPMIGNPIKQIQVYQSRRSGLNEMGKNHDGRPTKSTPKELYSSKEMRTVDDRDAHISISGNMNFLNEEVENDSTESLLTVPVLSAENPHIHQELWTTEKVSITHDIDFAKSEGSTASTRSVIEVRRSQQEIQSNQLNDETTTICDPVKSQSHLSYTKDSMFDSSEMVCGLLTSKGAWSNCSVGGCQKLKFQSDIVAAEVNSSEAEAQHHETSVLYETHSLHGFHNTIDSSYESSARKTVDYSEDLHEVPVAWAPNFEGSFCNPTFLDDQSAVLASSSNNTEMQLEVSVSEEPMMNNPASVVDDFETRQNEVSVACDNNMSLQSQSTIDDQSFVPASSSNNTEMQLEVSITEEPKMDNPVFVVDDFGIRQNKVSVARENNMQLQSQSTIDGLIIDRYEMQQEPCCASEMKKNGTFTSFEMQQDLHSACEMEDNGKVNSKHHFASETGEHGRVSNSIEPSGHAVAGLKAESYERQAHTATAVPLVVIESSGLHEVDNKRDINIISHSDRSVQHNAEKDKAKSAIVVYKSYVRRNKRKIEAGRTPDVRDSCAAFVRSPCEGLRPRASQAAYERDETKAAAKKAKVKATKMAVVSASRSAKAKGMGSYQCDLDGCSMNFRTRRELLLHKRNLCTYKGCGKQFSSHQYTTHHQRVHDDERPLKCPWKGCNMSFKWAWARTEHIRLHTGERPYKCKAAGCGLTFRFVSDFSRHRRKTGHM